LADHFFGWLSAAHPVLRLIRPVSRSLLADYKEVPTADPTLDADPMAIASSPCSPTFDLQTVGPGFESMANPQKRNIFIASGPASGYIHRKSSCSL
jgi:hypothetical protein